MDFSCDAFPFSSQYFLPGLIWRIHTFMTDCWISRVSAKSGATSSYQASVQVFLCKIPLTEICHLCHSVNDPSSLSTEVRGSLQIAAPGYHTDTGGDCGSRAVKPETQAITAARSRSCQLRLWLQVKGPECRKKH